MEPFYASHFLYAPQYAPTDPLDFGGPLYSEHLWLTGAASPALSEVLGPDAPCCGKDEAYGGGCGRCFLVRNPTARQAHWVALVMKKGDHSCISEGSCLPDRQMVSLAVPGFDQSRSGNRCDDPNWAEPTHITEAASRWCANISDTGLLTSCNCSGLLDKTKEQRILRNGCELFSEWGWTTPNPILDFQWVNCPPAWEDRIEGAFGEAGVQPAPAQLVEWMWVGVSALACAGLCLMGLIVRCWSARQERKALLAQRQEKARRKAARDGLSSSSSSSSASDESD